MPLRKTAVCLVRDDSGMLSSIDYILFVTIVTIGVVVGLANVRNAVLQEFGDVGVALENLPQTYTVDITFRNGSTQRFGWEDGTSPTDPPNQAPGGIDLVVPPSGDG